MSALPDRTRLLLATDLSGRCDRALERAVQLTRAWQAELHVVHALEPDAAQSRTAGSVPSWRRPESRSESAERRVRADLGPDAADAQLHIATGRASEIVADAARQQAADLVVTGLARDEPLARIQLGSTVDALVRAVPALLTVRRRVRGPYQHVVVATDFSPVSAPALEFGSRHFPDARLTLLHAYAVPGEGLTTMPMQGDAAQARAERAGEAFLAARALDAAAQRRLGRVLEKGSPEGLLPDYAEHHDVDLVILGSHGHGGFLKALLGSTAESLLHTLGCDVMIVRGR